MIEIFTYITAFLISYFGVGLLRRWILHKEILDIPNERSSHSTPTPRGGGLVIVAVSLGFYALGTLFLPIQFHWSYFVGAFCIALISWIDDLFSLSFGLRFIVHGAAALLVIVNLGYWQEVHVPLLGTINFGIWGWIITFCWIVWLTNAFNFMDGIDGIAGLQAVTAGIGWLIIGKTIGFDSAAIFGGVIAFVSFGFLLHNWEPAKIFMGDVGSAFLGFTFAVIPLLESNSLTSSYLPTIAVILVFCFLIDSMVTITVRLFKKEKVWEAHRKHFYQRLVAGGRSHQAVSLLYGLISSVLIVLLFSWLRSESL